MLVVRVVGVGAVTVTDEQKKEQMDNPEITHTKTEHADTTEKKRKIKSKRTKN